MTTADATVRSATAVTRSALEHLQATEETSYPNRQAERDRHYVVEDHVNGQVLRFGEFALQTAQHFTAQVRARRDAATELKATLDRLAKLPADGTLSIDALAEWDRASKEVDRLATLLEADAKNADWHLNRLENPLDTWDAMQHKYSALRTSI